MLSTDTNLVEVVFDYPTMKKPIGNPGQSAYIIHSINNESFEIIKDSIVVPSGILEIEIEFYQKTVGIKLAKSMIRDSYTFRLEKGKKYVIKYIYMDNTFTCKEV
jgi:hypothetical protein